MAGSAQSKNSLRRKYLAIAGLYVVGPINEARSVTVSDSLENAIWELRLRTFLRGCFIWHGKASFSAIEKPLTRPMNVSDRPTDAVYGSCTL